MDDRTLWCTIRRALLLIVDAIEKMFGIEPKTSELRKDMKDDSMK